MENLILENPFPSKAKNSSFCTPMSEGAAQEYVMAVMLESGDHNVDMEGLRSENILTIEIILRRIEAYNLPITFTPTGLIAAYAMTENVPGRAVALLIDCLTVFEGKTVTASMLAELYPYGFYSEKTFEDYVDNHLKQVDFRNSVKWATLY